MSGCPQAVHYFNTRVPVLVRTIGNHPPHLVSVFASAVLSYTHTDSVRLQINGSSLFLTESWLQDDKSPSIQMQTTPVEAQDRSDKWNLCPVLWELASTAIAVRLIWGFQRHEAQAAFFISTDFSVVQWHNCHTHTSLSESFSEFYL